MQLKKVGGWLKTMKSETGKFFGVQIVSSRQASFKVAAIYTLVGGLWILFSDQLLLWLFRDPRLITRLQTAKGWFFVLASAGLIAWLLRRNLHSLSTQFNQISTIFDSLNAVVYVADLESDELLYLNRYGASVFRENWQGSSCCEILHTGRTGPCESCPGSQLVRDGVPQAPCMWESHSQATGRWYQCIDRGVRWTDGRWVRLEIAVDITELKMLEQMKTDMVSVLTHEIRTPLTAMLGYTELLLGHELEPVQQESFLTIIQNETNRLNELIDDFLDLQRMETAFLTHDHVPIPVQRLLQDAATLFAAVSDRHRIVVTCAADIPQISGEESQLQRALKNLLANAVKYSPEGGTVSLGARQEDDDVVIWVRDEGVGIPPEELDKVFDKFYRVNNPAHRMVRGTGLGLALVRETMEAHGGRVWVESRLGAGSTFYVRLPVKSDG